MPVPNPADSRSQIKYKENRPTLQTCLEMFATPEQLEDNSVSCQKCNQQTGASKVSACYIGVT